MAVNEYDDILAHEEATQPVAPQPTIPVVNEYDAILDSEFQTQKQTLKQSMYVADQKSPDRQAQILKLSDKLKVPPSFVDRNYDELSKKQSFETTDYDAIIDKTPGLAKYLENPDNATLSSDDLGPLSKIEGATKGVTARQPEPSIFSDLSRAGMTGLNNLKGAAWHVAAAYGLTSLEDAAENAAAANKRSEELRAQLPNYAKEFNAVMEQEGGDVNRAVDLFKQSYKQLEQGNIMKALVGFIAAKDMSAGESLDQIGAAVVRPKGLAYSTVENLAHSLPSVLGSVAGGAAGTVGGPPGVAAGIFSGSFAGGAFTEVGSQINDSLTKRGYDITKPEDLMRAYSDPELMSQIKGEAERKGLTTAGIDALFNVVAGRFLTKGAGVGKRVGELALEAGVQGAGETLSEAGGQVAREKGFEGVNFGEALQEGITSLGHSASDVFIGASRRGFLHSDPVEGAKQLSKEVANAIRSQTDLQSLKHINDLVKESKTAKRMPEKIKEVVANTTEGTEDANVYFQLADWDNFWTKKGLSPAKAADQILEDGGKIYNEAKLTGDQLAIPLPDYASKVATSEQADELLAIAKLRPEALTSTESQEVLASAPASLLDLAKEAQALEAQAKPSAAPTESPQEIQAESVKNKVVTQLKEAGVENKVAVRYGDLYESVFKNLSERSGLNPLELYSRYGLNIQGPNQVTQDVNAPLDVEGEIAARQPVSGEDVTKDIKPQTLEQGPTLAQPGTQGPRGNIQIGNASININLLEKADFSTFLHETGHFYLEVLKDLGSQDTGASIKDDLATIRTWLGNKGEDFTMEQHEQFARGFEAYLMEGKAPSSALRKAFANFKVWLTSIYRSIRNLNVQLSDEVRGVFDRLIATDEEIANAQNELGHVQLFKDPLAAGMTPEQATKYQKAVYEAQDAAKQKLEGQVMKEYNRARQTWYKSELKKIENQTREELSKQVVYRAISLLKDGKMPDGSSLPEGAIPLKLNKKDVVALYDKSIVSKLPRGIYDEKAGLHPSAAAELLGFQNADEMVQLMANAPKLEDLAKQMAKQQMSGLYPEIVLNGKIEEEALNAVHSEKRSELLRLELEHILSNNHPLAKQLIRKISKRVPTDSFVKAQVSRILGSKKLNELNPNQYMRNEAKYAKMAGELLAKGDINAAFDAKKNELINHELALAAIRAKEDIKKSQVLFKRILAKDDKIAKTRDMDLVNAARAIMASYGIGKADKPASSYLDKIKTYDPDTYETVSAMVEASSKDAKNFRETTFDAYSGMFNDVQAIWSIAKTSQEMTIEGKKISKEQAKSALSSRLGEMNLPKNRKGYDKALSNWDKTKINLMGMKSALRRVEPWADSMDSGKLDGPFRKYIWNPISESIAKYRKAKEPFMKKYLDLLNQIKSSLTNKTIDSKELGYQFKDKAELLGAMLHSGNESNLSKLLKGRGWADVDINGNVNAGRWYAFLKRMITEGVVTKADYDFLQGVWDLHESVKADAQRVHKKLYGHYFNEITAQKITTPWGEYKGGYVPAISDPYLTSDAAQRQEKEALSKSDNSFMFPTSGRGFTKSRVESYSAPLMMDLRLAPTQIDKVLRFIHIEPAVKEVGRLVMDKEFRKLLDTFDPTVSSDMLVPWLQRSAQQMIQTQTKGFGGKGIDKFFKELRKRTGLQTMAVNVVNSLQQITGLSMAAVKVKPKYLRDALWTYMRNPSQTMESVRSKSEYMETRSSAQLFDIQKATDEIILHPTKIQRMKEFAEKHGYFLQAGFQNFVDTITWTGAYDEATANGLSEQNAVKAADSAVRLTQGSFNPEDVSRFETGTPFMRAFTMFYSYFNMQANLLGSEFEKTMRDMGLRKGAGRLLYVYTLGFMIPAVMSELLVKAMSGKGLDDDDDDQYLDDLMQLFFGSQFRTATALFPIIGPTARSALSRFNDNLYDDRISLSPAVNAIESAVGAPKSVYDAVFGRGDKRRAVKDVLSFMSLMTGIPLAPLGRPLNYAIGVGEGKIQGPKNPVEATRGLLTGTGEKR